MKRFFICAVTVLFCALTSGCVSTAPVTNNTTPESQRKLQLHSAAVLDAFMAKDYQQLRGLLSDNIAAEFPEEKFSTSIKQLEKTLGTMKNYLYLTELKVPILRTMVYKVTFERTGSKQEKITQEALFRITMAEDKGKVIVLSFNFF
jgi:hypothetical protein